MPKAVVGIAPATWFKGGRTETFYFFGRPDNQVKLRGLRIELEEIEHHLQEFPWVKRAVVKVKDDCNGKQLLQAYLEVDKTLDAERGFQHLRQRMPVPSKLIQLGALPLNARVRWIEIGLVLRELGEK